MEYPDDGGLVTVLTSFGIAPDAYLGHGGEAYVYALDGERVLRVLHSGGRPDDITRRQALVDELARSSPPYALPQTLEVGDRAGRVFAIERRLPGRSLMNELRTADGHERQHLIETHLQTAAALGDLPLEPRAHFGDLINAEPVTAPTWREYLERRAAKSLAGSAPDLRAVDPVPIADALPDTTTPDFVHLDAFTANMLTDGVNITAVLDFGATCVVGDRRLDPIAAVVYLASPDITPTATAADVDVAMSWLRNAGLDDLFQPARRWLAAYWSFAVDDPLVLRWRRSVLEPA